MKLVCPSCGAVHSAEAWSNDPVARQCLKLAGEMPHAVASRCFAYLSLFRPAPPSILPLRGTPPSIPPLRGDKGGDLGGCQRSLQWKKVLRLLSELKELVTLPHVQWERKVARPNSAHAWGMAMEKVIENPPKRLPLKTHGYLRAIAYEICDDLDKKIEVKRNQSERDGSFHSRHSGESGNPVEPERVSLEIMKDLRKQNMGTRKHEGTKTRKDND